jgi:hypothetical protein
MSAIGSDVVALLIGIVFVAAFIGGGMDVAQWILSWLLVLTLIAVHWLAWVFMWHGVLLKQDEKLKRIAREVVVCCSVLVIAYNAIHNECSVTIDTLALVCGSMTQSKIFGTPSPATSPNNSPLPPLDVVHGDDDAVKRKDE